MTTGIQSGSSKHTVVCRLVDGASAANGKPSEAAVFSAVGVEAPLLDRKGPTYASIRIYNPAGTGVVTVDYARLWVGQADPTDPGDAAGKWFPAGVGTDANKGKINNGAALGETSADKLRHSEVVVLPSHCDRLYAELGAITGSTVAINVDLVFARHPDFESP